MWCLSRINISPYTIFIICKPHEESAGELQPSILKADDTCILQSHQNVKFIERNLNYDFANLCEWFIDKKTLYLLEKIKLKSILFKRGSKSNLPLTITCNVMKEHPVVEYLGCLYVRGSYN